MKINEISLGQIGAGIKGAISGSRAGIGATAGFKDAAQARGMQQNTQALAQTALTQWGKKVMALTNAAGGQPISDDEYNDHLKDYVQKVLLGNRTIDKLDANSQARIDASIDAVMKNRNDRAKLSQAFNQLVTQASVARADPAQQSQQTVNVDNMIYQLSQRGVAKTNNQSVDALLQALGIPLK